MIIVRWLRKLRTYDRFMIELMIILWQVVTNDVVDVNNVNQFKTRLDKFWMHQDVKFDFTADLTGIGVRVSLIIMWRIVLYLILINRCGQWGVSPASVNSHWVELSWFKFFFCNLAPVFYGSNRKRVAECLCWRNNSTKFKLMFRPSSVISGY